MDAENNNNAPAIALPLFHEDIYTGMRACLCIIYIYWVVYIYIYIHMYTYQATNADLYNICSVWDNLYVNKHAYMYIHISQHTNILRNEKKSISGNMYIH